MTSPQPTMGELYVRAMDSAAGFVNAVRPDRWHVPTPCTEWDLRVLVRHMTYENLWAGELFRGKTMEEVGERFDGDILGDDPIGAFNRSIEAATAGVSVSGAMQAVCHLSFGDFPGAEYAKQLFQDLLIHGWDVAKASGQDATLEPALVDACHPLAVEMMALAEGSGAFGAPVLVSEEDPKQTRLLALLGRRADWSPAAA